MYEHHSKPVIPFRAFIRRLSLNTLIAALLTAISLGVGMIGYRVFEGFSWTDCFLNASMILGGMGEIGDLKTDAGKIFAGCFALYAGLLVVVTISLIIAPVLHRMIHHFHAHRPPSH